jgi:hypothetical protein
MIINVYWSTRKVPVFFDRWNVNFLDIFSKNNQVSYFMKILRVGAELFLANGRTDRQGEDNSRFSQFYESA